MLDAYHLNKEETDMREAKQMTQPVVIQRLLILKETIEEEYLGQATFQTMQTKEDTESMELWSDSAVFTNSPNVGCQASVGWNRWKF